MKATQMVFVIALCSLTPVFPRIAHAQNADVAAMAGALPRVWHGTWAGNLTVHSQDGASFERGMELAIEPDQDAKNLTWRMVSEFRGRTTVRNYELVAVSGEPGHYEIDEKNGIVLDAWLMGTVLYTYYKDGDVLITARYELRKEGLSMELATVDLAKPRVSTLKEEEETFEVHSFRLLDAQTGILVKQSK